MVISVLGTVGIRQNVVLPHPIPCWGLIATKQKVKIPLRGLPFRFHDSAGINPLALSQRNHKNENAPD